MLKKNDLSNATTKELELVLRRDRALTPETVMKLAAFFEVAYNIYLDHQVEDHVRTTEAELRRMAV